MKSYQIALPGPTECDPRVLSELSKPILPHYGDEWLSIYDEIIRRLQRVYQTKNTVFVIPSSGSGAIDAVFTSLGAKTGLILSNGTFGQRMHVIASRNLKHVELMEIESGQAFDPDSIEKKLKAGRFDLLAVVHGETSTGMLNGLDSLSELCRSNNLLFIVDAVSTLGGVPLDVDAQGIDFCISASQKALGAPPGLAMVSISERGWSSMQSEESIRSWYLNLQTWKRYSKEWADWHPYPVTLPVHLLFALHKALELIFEDGLPARWRLHHSAAKYVQKELERIGIKNFVGDPNRRLPTVTAATLPTGLSSKQLQSYLREDHGILVAGGVGQLQDKIFRIGQMGYSARPELLKRVLSAVSEFMSIHQPSGVL
jgi:alanine-glyoxylate transaminase/serine-glyoxylate transaminase/serine-pyruvate transaminase